MLDFNVHVVKIVSLKIKGYRDTYKSLWPLLSTNWRGKSFKQCISASTLKLET